ncbi:hypothetical protein [Ruminiclostridium josui]
MDKVQQELKKKHPIPQTEDFTELARYNNWIRETAQEIVMKEVVRVPR